MQIDSEEEAIRVSYDVENGIVAGLWTSAVYRAHRVAAEIEAGLVTVNTFRTTHWMLPYGGLKKSGMGRGKGVGGLHHHTEGKNVVGGLCAAPPPRPFLPLPMPRDGRPPPLLNG